MRKIGCYCDSAIGTKLTQHDPVAGFELVVVVVVSVHVLTHQAAPNLRFWFPIAHVAQSKEPNPRFRLPAKLAERCGAHAA